MTETIIQFYSDKQVAALFGVSTSWVRLQRFNRRHGKAHVFDVDPVLMGATPRYLRTDIESFMSRLIEVSTATPRVLA